MSIPISFSFFYWFRKLIKKQDVVHLHYPFPLAAIALCLFKFKGKIVITWHSDIVRQRLAALLLSPFINYSLKRADSIIVSAKGNITNSNKLWKYEDKCVVIPFSIKTHDFIYQSHEGDNTHVLHLLFIGRLVYYKGCEVMLRAFALTTGVSLTIIGNGKLESRLKQMARDLRIENRVRFLGAVTDEEKNRQLQACDVLVFPSIAKSEAFGLVQLEAMAYGKPVINTNLPSGVPEVSIHNETGLTVETNDVEALAAAIAWLQNHSAERFRMGTNARQRVETLFTPEKEMRDILTVYGPGNDNLPGGIFSKIIAPHKKYAYRRKLGCLNHEGVKTSGRAAA